MRSIVLLLNKESKYGVLGQMVQDIQKAFKRRKMKAVIAEVNPDDPGAIKKIVEKEAADCTWSINTYIDEQVVYLPLGVPHVDLSVDSVTYSCIDSMIAPHIISLFVDKVSCELFSSCSKNPVYWFPHAISKEMIDRARSSEMIQLAKRPYDVALIGSFVDHEREKRLWSSIFEPSIVDAFVGYAERLLADPDFPFAEETYAYLKQTDQVRKVTEALAISKMDLLNSIERYGRGLERERILNALSNRSIHIFTGPEDAKEWSKVGSAKRYHFEPSVPFGEVIDVCMKSRVVINSAPHIRKGYHERLFLSLVSGAVTLIGKGHLLPDWLVQNGRVVVFDSSNLQGLDEKLQEAEKRPFDAKKILSWLESEHTWDARLHQHLSEIERSVEKIHAGWEANPFFRFVE